LISGQRSGFFAGVIACIPFVFQFKKSAIIPSLVAVAIATMLSVLLLQSFPKQAEFLTRRYLNTTKTGTSIRLNTTGRDQRWAAATKKILERPIIGHGVAADKKAGIGGFHNSFLQEWYNGGVAGLLLFSGGCLYALFKTFRIWRNKFLIHEHRQLGCVLFSWMIVLILSGCFESKLASPSNIMAFTMILVSVMAHRLDVYALQSRRDCYRDQNLI
ncbi:O-antigen ligase family protein, partial [bacterium]|nr:O-antigen ligase family protein [bacterium]